MRGAARAVAAAVAALTAVATVPMLASPAGAQTYWVRASGKVVIHGHGFGHGHGMSQYGAQGAALAGKSYRQIVGFYYPHTRLDQAGGPLRVLLSVGSSDVTVQPTRRLRVRDLADKKTWLLPTKAKHARQWRIGPTLDRAQVSSVQYRDGSGWHRWNLPGPRKVLRGDGQFSAPGPIGLVLSDGSVRRYRGSLRSASASAQSTSRDVVNVVSLDQYIRGVLPAEMPSSWNAPALRAQAVAARTFAAWSRRVAGNHYWQVCDTTSCQVYAGVNAETERTDAAVKATAGKILRHRGKPAFTQFSASSGGWTSAGGKPYLPAKADPWDDWAGNDYHSWRRRVGVATLENRYPGLGRLEAIRVRKREGHGMWGGRALLVVLRGSKDRVRLTGDDMRWALELPSTWFSFELTDIQRKWQRLGGARSPLGAPLTRERHITSGAGRDGLAQKFAHGRILWSKRTDAHALHGRVLAAYHRHGGFHSRLGYPTTSVHRVPVGKRARFQHGSITMIRATGHVRVRIRR